MKSDLVDIACIIKRETEAAICVDHGGREFAWLPKSQIEIERGKGGSDIVTMPQWLAEEKRIV